MTSTNEAANGQAEKKAEETPATSSRKTTTRRQANKGGLVKSKVDKGDIFVLDDHTRLAPTEYLPNHRPIALSDMEIVGSLNSSGSRPIMADTFEVFTTDLLPGHRPVMVSQLPLSELNFLPGNRPIAPNDLVDPPASVLMGYLD
jgi:hypothetical protein